MSVRAWCTMHSEKYMLQGVEALINVGIGEFLCVVARKTWCGAIRIATAACYTFVLKDGDDKVLRDLYRRRNNVLPSPRTPARLVLRYLAGQRVEEVASGMAGSHHL